jgi:hypothetical protein
MNVFVTFIFLVCILFFNNANATFDEKFSKKMINFVSASFIDSQTQNSVKLAKQCFSKSYPNTTDWEIIVQYTIQPCANRLTDKCGTIITVSESLKMLIIAFHGTLNSGKMAGQSQGVWLNLIDWPANPSMGKVNKNLNVAVEVMWSTHIEAALKKYKGYKVALVGHSLGGSFASMTALKARVLGNLDSSNFALYTFGEARFGDSQLIKNFQTYITNGYRVIHNSDVVPHLPYCDGILDYSCKSIVEKPYHHPQEIWYNNDQLTMNDGDYKICSSSNGEDKDCSNSISNTVFLTNIMSPKAMDIHLHYYNHKLDDYGISGCTA